MDWPHLLSVSADVASIGGLLITGLVWLNVRRIREFYRYRARVPELIGLLDQKASNLSTFLADYTTSKHSIELELAEAAAIVRALVNNSRGDPKNAAKRLASRLEQSQPSTAVEARQMYVALRTLIVTYQQFQSDSDWEP